MKSVFGFIVKAFFFIIILVCIQNTSWGQVELEPWGNITAIRVDGQPMQFESSLRVVHKNWAGITATGRERQKPKYLRNGNVQTVATIIDGVSCTESVEDAGKGVARLNISISAEKDHDAEGVFLALALPGDYFNKADFRSGDRHFVLEKLIRQNVIPLVTSEFQIVAPNRKLIISTKEQIPLFIKKETINHQERTVIYLPVHTGSLVKGQTYTQTITITASGLIDNQPVHLAIQQDKTGRSFAGLGGNFRLQNPKDDPQVIDYCLKNLRVAWGRVEMPWRLWQPEMNVDPVAEAKAGRLNQNVQKAMEMAQRLDKMGVPVILTVWFPPAWAVEGELKSNPPQAGEAWGNALNHSRDIQIYKSIADYIQYAKDQYGVEFAMFSFNESDLGIDIRQTGEEHAALIKGLGAYLASRGLKTKMLLGDNSDATTYKFINPALNDPATHPYIGAVSFHSWRGWETETLQQWANAASKLKLPLLVGEGSIDAAAWNYPAIFEEPIYAMDEINLYIRLLAICQPESILQWQLTSDYSPLAGGGIFGNSSPLHPTQRFWNLKQLASTPEGLQAMSLTCDRPLISGAALGNRDKDIYAVHLVNNGASRTAVLSGIPRSVKSLHIYITNKNKCMEKGKPVVVKNGIASFPMESASFITVISDQRSALIP